MPGLTARQNKALQAKLPQELLPNQKGIKLFGNSEFLGYEDVITLTPEQIREERELKGR